MDFLGSPSDGGNTNQLFEVVNHTFSSVSYRSCVFVNNARSFAHVGVLHQHIFYGSFVIDLPVKNTNIGESSYSNTVLYFYYRYSMLAVENSRFEKSMSLFAAALSNFIFILPASAFLFCRAKA